MTCILGIESSCDETAAAVVADGQEILLMNVPGSMVARDHADAPPVGLVEVNRLCRFC